ncbi:unnamed protein product [Discula destructiva]
MLSQGQFAPRVLAEGLAFTGGIRLLLQTRAKDPKAFAPSVLSLEATVFRSLMTSFKLPLRYLESSSAVGPFFWWTHERGNLQMVFRKSDVEWKGTSRGWELMLSYSPETNITSGYVRAMETFKFQEILVDLQACGKLASHPLLLPVLVLCHELSSVNDEEQREQRKKLRKLENALSQRYEITPAAHYGPETDVELDRVSRDLADCQCKVLQKRPQAWQNIIKATHAALEYYWQSLPDNKRTPAIHELHQTLASRLDFLSIKLKGIENYAHVTFERLNIHREVLHNIINQRESRLNFEIAIQQRKLAIASGRESTSMKTLTIMGLFFLPGTFLSSLFGMPFFSFTDMEGPVSKSLWIYFIITLPLTGVIVGLWYIFDQRHAKKIVTEVTEIDDDGRPETEEEKEGRLLEARIMRNIRRRTGVRVADTFELRNLNQQPKSGGLM